MKLSVQFENDNEVFSLEVDKSVFVCTLDKYEDWDDNTHTEKLKQTVTLLREVKDLWTNETGHKLLSLVDELQRLLDERERLSKKGGRHERSKILKRFVVSAKEFIRSKLKTGHLSGAESGSFLDYC